MKKRLISLTLIFAMLLCVLPLTAFAEGGLFAFKTEKTETGYSTVGEKLSSLSGKAHTSTVVKFTCDGETPVYAQAEDSEVILYTEKIDDEYTRIHFLAAGSASLSTGDDPSASIPVTVSSAAFGFYEDINLDTPIGSKYIYGESRTFYFFTNSKSSIDESSVETGTAPVTAELVAPNIIKLTVSDEADRNFSLQLNYKLTGGGAGSAGKSLIYVDVSGKAAEVEIEQKDYVIGFAFFQGEDIVSINEGEWAFGLVSTPNTDSGDEYAYFRDIPIIAATKAESGNSVSYTKSDEITNKITVKSMSIECIKGFEDTFSLEEGALTKSLAGTKTDKLYARFDKAGSAFLKAVISVDGIEEEFEIKTCVFNTVLTERNIDRPNGDTVQALNDYLENDLPGIIEELKDEAADNESITNSVEFMNTSGGMSGTSICAKLNLASKYTGEIFIPSSFSEINLDIIGKKNGDGTTIDGSINLGGKTLRSIRNIKFNATEENTKALFNGGTSHVTGCYFSKYQVAVESTEHGVFTLEDGNVFEDNRVAVSIDIEDCDSGMNRSTWALNKYINNTTAIKVNSTNRFISPYYLRIYDSDFLGNTTDFDLQCEGSFYFYRNYYGDNDNNTRVPIVNLQNGAKAITNPRRSAPTSNSTAPLTIDTLRETAIKQEEAGNLVIDETDKLTNVSIKVVTENETLGTWIFE